MTKRITKALEELKAAFAEKGIEDFTIKLLDIEDARLIKDWKGEDLKSVPNHRREPLAFIGKLDGFRFTWPNKWQAEQKDPEFEAKRLAEARRLDLLSQADKAADRARADFLKGTGIEA